MDATQRELNLSNLLRSVVNVVLLLVTLGLSVVVFFVVQEMVMLIANHLVLTSPNLTTQQRYTLATIRNFAAIISGLIMISFLIFSIDFHTKRLDNAKTTKLLLWTLGIEVFIIIIRLIM